jgi:hypothetical protein
MEQDMRKILTTYSDIELKIAVEEHFFEMLSLLKLLPGSAMHDDPGLMWLITDIQFPLFNPVFRTNISDNN